MQAAVHLGPIVRYQIDATSRQRFLHVAFPSFILSKQSVSRRRDYMIHGHGRVRMEWGRNPRPTSLMMQLLPSLAEIPVCSRKGGPFFLQVGENNQEWNSKLTMSVADHHR